MRQVGAKRALSRESLTECDYVFLRQAPVLSVRKSMYLIHLYVKSARAYCGTAEGRLGRSQMSLFGAIRVILTPTIPGNTSYLLSSITSPARVRLTLLLEIVASRVERAIA